MMNVIPLYNGNISSTTTVMNGLEKIGFNYKYDQLNRLITSVAFRGLISVIILCLIPSCQVSQYASAVLEENQNLLEKNKSLIKHLKFTGTIINKEKGRGKYKYILWITMDTVFLQEIAYLPYYQIKGNQINIVVTKNVYNQLVIADTVLKENKSEYFFVNGQKLPLVSSEKYRWLPTF